MGWGRQSFIGVFSSQTTNIFYLSDKIFFGSDVWFWIFIEGGKLEI
jgi:hypothetical protein